MALRVVQPFAVVTAGDAEKTGWKVLNVEIGIDGEPSSVQVEIPASRVESYTTFDPDTRLFVKRDHGGADVVVFKGRALNPTITWDPGTEEVLATFYGTEWDLGRAHIFGQYAQGISGVSWLTALKATFNPDGEQNHATGSSPHEFEADLEATSGRDSWHAKDAIEFLIERFNAEVENLIDDTGTSWPSNAATLVLFNIPINGMTYAQAITEVCRRSGYSWSLQPKDDLANKSDFVIWKRGDIDGLTPKQLYLPAASTAIGALSEANRIAAVPGGQVGFDHFQVATGVIGYGAVKIYEKVWTLKKGWSAADEATVFAGSDIKEKLGAFRRLTTRDRDSYEANENVGRRYILNETGREDTNPASTAYDFQSDFDGSDHATRPRPYLPHLVSRDADGKYKKIRVLVDDVLFGGGSGTVEGEWKWVLLKGIAGIFFTGETIPYRFEKAGRDDDIQAGFPTTVAIEAALRSDTAISSAETPSGADLSTSVVRVLDLTGKFQWNNKNGDTTLLTAYVDAKAEQMKRMQQTGRFLLEEIVSGYEVGDWLDSIGGRSITLYANIVRLRWDPENQTTELITESGLADVFSSGPVKPVPAATTPGRTSVASGSEPITPQMLKDEAEFMKRHPRRGTR